MDYYEDVSGRQLADEFYSELRFFFQKAADSPGSNFPPQLYYSTAAELRMMRSWQNGAHALSHRAAI
jgi:hypothetical protein